MLSLNTLVLFFFFRCALEIDGGAALTAGDFNASQKARIFAISLIARCVQLIPRPSERFSMEQLSAALFFGSREAERTSLHFPRCERNNINIPLDCYSLSPIFPPLSPPSPLVFFAVFAKITVTRSWFSRISAAARA